MKERIMHAAFPAFLLAVALLAGCTSSAGNSSGGSGTILSAENSAEPEVQVIEGCIAGMTREEVITNSCLVVLGSVAEISDDFQIQPANGGEPSVFTDFTMQITEVLRGAPLSDAVTVRTQGGETDTLITVMEEEPKLEKEKTYLLFLYKPGVDNSYYTGDDCYYITGVDQGVYELTEDTQLTANASLSEQAIDADIVFVNMGYENSQWNLRDMLTDIDTINESVPADENYRQQQALENMQANLEAGFITQEDYDQYVTQSQQYATIVTE